MLDIARVSQMCFSEGSQRASAQPPEEKKRFNTTLSRPKGGASLTGKRWDLSCFTMGKPIGKGRFGEGSISLDEINIL